MTREIYLNDRQLVKVLDKRKGTSEEGHGGIRVWLKL